MIRIDFTEEVIEKLRYERFHHPQVQRKMEALLLKSDGLPHHRITRILGISENTFRQYLREYEEGGIDRLKEIHFHRPQSELADHRESLENYFEDHPPAGHPIQQPHRARKAARPATGRFSLVAFGGAGPVHAYQVARKLRLKTIIVPPGAGVSSGAGSDGRRC